MTDFSISVGNKNGRIIVNEYEGEFSLLSGYEGRDGKEYWNMVFRRDGKTKEPTGKAMPQKVNIGSADQAPGILRQIADFIEKQGDDQPEPEPQWKSSIQGDDEIPF